QSACLYHCRDLLFANGNSAIPGQGIPLLHPLQITSNGNAPAVQVSVIRWQLNCIVWPQMIEVLEGRRLKIAILLVNLTKREWLIERRPRGGNPVQLKL